VEKSYWIAKSIEVSADPNYISLIGNLGLTDKSNTYSKAFDKAVDILLYPFVQHKTGPPSFMPYETLNGPVSYGFDGIDWLRAAPLREVFESNRIAIGNPDRLVFVPRGKNIITLILEGRSSNSEGGSQDTRNSQPLDISKRAQGITFERFGRTYHIFYIPVWDGTNTWNTLTNKNSISGYKFNKELSWGAFPVSILVLSEMVLSIINNKFDILNLSKK
jgi:hypothetical protein